MTEFVLGATAMGCLTVALFFAGFWRSTGDRFFAWLSLGFALFAVNRCVLALVDEAIEERTFAYGIRLLAFVLIAIAILEKNREHA